MIIDSLLASAETSAGRPAVADPSAALDYGTLVRFADALRRIVEAETTCPRVGIMMPSSCGFAAAFYGVLWAGRTVVPLNFLLQPAEVAAVIKDAEIDLIFTIKHFAETLAPLPIKKIVVDELPIQRELAAAPTRTLPSAPNKTPEDIALLLYTSGTAGVPKGVQLSYGNLAHDVNASIEHARLKEDHRFLGVLPLFHTFGLTAMLLIPAKLGASVYFVPRFSGATFADTVRTQRSSILMMVASMYSAILRAKRGDKEDFASIVYPVSGGEALPEAVFHGFRDRFGVEICEGYGMTEASPVVSLNVPWAARLGSVGRAIPGVTVRAFDDNCKELPLSPPLQRGGGGACLGDGGTSSVPDPGITAATGELWIRGPIIMQGYFKKLADTKAVLTDNGWYKSSDMGYVDTDGYIFITGRKKEMIIVGGENVYPREVEAALDLHPAVAESAVIGERDPMRGEVVVAFVTLREGQAATDLALRNHCRDYLAGYKIPRRVIIRQDLPRGPTGKILKRKLGELLAAEPQSAATESSESAS